MMVPFSVRCIAAAIVIVLSITHTFGLHDEDQSDRERRSLNSGSRLRFSPSRRAYEFDTESDIFECSYSIGNGNDFEEGLVNQKRSAPATLVVRNQLVGIDIASERVDPENGANITFKVKRIQTSTTFSCELHIHGKLRDRQFAQVFVFTFIDMQCSTNKDCWGFGRNVVCDVENSRRCMCAAKTARTAASPICIEVVTEAKCDHMICEDNDDDCVCTRDPAIVLKSTEYHRSSGPNDDRMNDRILIFNKTQQTGELYLTSKRDECRRCLRTSNNLQNLQVGLFLVGVVLAFTAVILMAVVIRKMWHHYRIPADLLEASRDLERETIEREAEQMAQRDKPPTYVEVMEYDLRISGYPPPDYEDLATVVRQHSDRRRQRRCRRNQSHPPANPVVTIQPAAVVRRPIFTTFHHRFTLVGSNASSAGTERSERSEPPTYENTTRQRY